MERGIGDGVSAPYDEPLLFRQKWLKPCWPWHGPSGALRGSPAPVAGKLAGLKHCPPFFRGRLHCSAMPPGLGGLEGKGDALLTQSPLAAESDLSLG